VNIYQKPRRAVTEALLMTCNLPTQDLTDDHFEHFFGCGKAESPAGVVGVELHGSAGLLRSLAVAESARGAGLGKRLIQEAERYAAQQGVQDLFLLTNSAAELFMSLGYTAIPRHAAPASIQATNEFSSICPASATLMRKRVAG